MSDMTFDEYGTKSWQDVKNMATTVIGNGPGNQIKLDWGGDPVPNGQDNKFGPRYHNTGDGHGHALGDPILGSCDYGHPLNFGAPSGPCADHFPIILVQGEIEIKDMPYEDTPKDESTWDSWYIQGVVIIDTLSDGQGGEFELESPGTFAGLMIGKGCIQLQDGSQTYGAVFVDGNIQQETCENPPLELNQGDHDAYKHTDLYYSECVVQTVLQATGMGEETTEGGGRCHQVPLARVRRDSEVAPPRHPSPADRRTGGPCPTAPPPENYRSSPRGAPFFALRELEQHDAYPLGSSVENALRDAANAGDSRVQNARSALRKAPSKAL
jgi:hypothetical protein